MGIKQKTIFISYRRTNFYTALAVYQDLTAHGYDVFFDYESIESGDFETVIFENIRYRAHFVVILSPSALERLGEKNSVMRREVELAIDEKRNIIPLVMENFDFGSPSAKEALTEKLAVLPKFNGVGFVPEYYKAALEKLRRFLNVELEEVRQPALSAAVEEDTEKRQAKASEEPPVDEKSLTVDEWFERGFVFQKDKNFAKALLCYSEAIKLESLPVKIAMFYSNIGVIYSDINNYEKAEEAYRKAIKTFPSLSSPYNNLATLFHEKLKRYKDAEVFYKKAIGADPKQAQHYSNLGNLLTTLKRYKDAEEIYKKAIPNNFENSNLHYSLGIVQQLQNNFIEALENFYKALELEENNTAVRITIIGLLKKMDLEEKSQEQERVVRKAIEKEDEYNRACFESLCGNVDEALELLTIAIKKGQSSKAWAKQDPDLENLRADPRFWEIIGEEMPSKE